MTTRSRRAPEVLRPCAPTAARSLSPPSSSCLWRRLRGQGRAGDHVPLVNHNKLTASQGYKVFYSGAEGQNLIQGGGAKFPVENVVVKPGWNWIGHAPLIGHDVNSGIVAVSGQFTIDDQIKARSGSTSTLCTYSGSKFEPAFELMPVASATRSRSRRRSRSASQPQ